MKLGRKRKSVSNLRRYQDKEVYITTEDSTGLSGNDFLRAVFEQQSTIIGYDYNDTYLTVYDPDSSLPDKVRALGTTKELLVWSPLQ